MTTIPRVIHQTWKTSEVPERIRKFQRTWQELNKGWEYRLWTDKDIDNLIRVEYEWFVPYWDAYPHQIQRVDAFRYFVMHRYGGVYADMDMQCLAPFDALLKQLTRQGAGFGVVVGDEGQVHSDGVMRAGNALLISEREHPFWTHVFEGLIRSHNKSTEKRSSVFVTTGPSFLHEVIRAHPQGVKVLPTEAFYPIPWSMPKETTTLVSRKQYPKSWAAHHWEGVWRDAPMLREVGGIKYAMHVKKKQGRGIIERSLERGEVWRADLLGKLYDLVQEGDAVIVVGAYTGNVAVPLATRVGQDGLVYCFEPDERVRELLVTAARSNDVEDILQVDARAVGESPNGRMYCASPFNPSKPHRVVWRPVPTTGPVTINYNLQQVPSTNLDSIGLGEVSLLHINANGEEVGVLRGAQSLIRENRPVISVENWDDAKRVAYGSKTTEQDTFDLLDSLGYTFSAVEGNAYLCFPS